MNGGSQKLLELAERVEKAEGPDRELDLDIAVALEPSGDIARVIKDRRGFDGKSGMSWDLWQNAVCFEKRDDRGDCFFNGGYPLPQYSASLDAALTLVPEGFRWKLGYSRYVPCVAELVDYRVQMEPNLGTFVSECDSSHALALCAAALRARAALGQD